MSSAVTNERPVAIVTGASRGIGRAIAVELSSTHRVLATYRGREDAARSLQAETGAEIFQVNLSSCSDRAELIELCREKFGRLDLLVNNAGMAPRIRADILEATEESFEELIETNLKGPYFLTQLAARFMLERGGGGNIIFVTSVSAYTSSIHRGDYCVSKAGLSMAVKLFADRLASAGIGVFEIRPGVIETDMIASVKGKYEGLVADGMLPLARLGRPEDVSRAVRAIADGLLPYSTGQVLDVDGGWHLRRL